MEALSTTTRRNAVEVDAAMLSSVRDTSFSRLRTGTTIVSWGPTSSPSREGEEPSGLKKDCCAPAFSPLSREGSGVSLSGEGLLGLSFTYLTPYQIF